MKKSHRKNISKRDFDLLNLFFNNEQSPCFDPNKFQFLLSEVQNLNKIKKQLRHRIAGVDITPCRSNVVLDRIGTTDDFPLIEYGNILLRTNLHPLNAHRTVLDFIETFIQPSRI